MNRSNRDGPVEILLVEDNPADVALVEEGLRDGRIVSHVTAIGEGDEALAFLRREASYGHAPRPDLIVLDLKLPGQNGLDILAAIKADKSLRRIPVIVFTMSEAREDILQAYDLQASCYISKPSDIEEFNHIMNSLQDFCLTVVKLPPRE
jgi:CheY-like chemotaxis protein